MTLPRYAGLVLSATFVLLLVGGTVNPTGSSLACPDWPTCYGTFFPEMKNGVEFEHTHRVVASAVGLLTFGLAFGIARRHRGPLRALGFVAAALVVAQGLLGGLTVVLRLPTMVSTAHLAVALGFFALIAYLCFRLATAPVVRLDPGLSQARGLAAITSFFVYSQILLGAFVRHTRAGRACRDLPFCDGSAWPLLPPQQLHMAHRYVGVLLFAWLIVVGLLLLRAARTGPPLVRLVGLLLPSLAALQVLLGLLTVASNIGWVAAMLHLGVGALLLLASLAAWFALGGLGAVPVTAAHGPAPVAAGSTA